MKIVWVKAKEDEKSFRFPEAMGWKVLKIQEVEETDKRLEELVQENYDTIVISNQLSYFSEDIIRKYQKQENINIIIHYH